MGLMPCRQSPQDENRCNIDYIITFKNTNHAVQGENFLLAEDIDVTVLPLPSEIKEGCGICLKIKYDSLDKAMFVLIEKAIPDLVLYEKISKDGEVSYCELKSWSP